MLRIAIYHLSIKIISRGKGKSAVAAAAYRAGEKIQSEYEGITHDYTRKGGIEHTEILLPENAPVKYSDRAILWNAVEKIEKAENAQMAREVEIALPRELTKEQNISLVCEYAKTHFVAAGMCADICIHDGDGKNPHAHIMLTMRPFRENGQWGAKERKDYAKDGNGERIPIIDLATGLQKVDSRNRKQWKRVYVQANDWNNRGNIETWRAAWSDICNKYLERNEHKSRIDHRSYARQGIEQIPTIHVGVAASQMEQKGIATERGNINREINVTNRLIRTIAEKIKQLRSWLKEMVAPAAPPTLIDTLQQFHNNGGRFSQPFAVSIRTAKSAHSLKDVSKAIDFLEHNNISTVKELRAKLNQGRQDYLVLKRQLQGTTGDRSRLNQLEDAIVQMETILRSEPVVPPPRRGARARRWER